MADPPPLTTAELSRLAEFLYRRTGMVFTEAKRYYVERRVFERMSATSYRSFADYFAHLRLDADNEAESLINAFTVNETYFYREDHQLACLTTDLLERRVAEKRPGDRIRIWSAPCSTGEEPYSLAIWLLENWKDVDAYEIDIVGSDIDTDALQAAEQGIFGRRALMKLSPQLIRRYFQELDDERWLILDELRRSVRFSRVNLVDSGQTRPQGGFDVIFCRNMLIYFDEQSRRIAAENLYDNLLPGGFICLGHTESMSRISPLFEVCRYADAIVYRRPHGAGA
ncbi:protein-glutamate O-methyltransferase CheR [Bradyrhizobium sp. 83002]|uniref:CheR family methyltransferase n=1 Tax=Bradyrhizobium aeschynomenes TaxID=2734909 RepID=UPI001556C22A|nr:protein-glutamate O-methyltransferase CheR [Bradyrhizobium aeschynomenes]NPU11410.1 protein-glutamate O-methyltransferase CheR [Bradyrhizobium aeschynomenes]